MKLFSLSFCAAAYGAAIWHCCPLDTPLEKVVTNEVTGDRVISVFSGDTLTIRVSGEPVTVRIDGVDAPSAGEPCADQSRAALEALVKDRPLRLAVTGRDKDALALARVWSADGEIGEQMLRQGWAVYRGDHEADLDAALLVDAEAEARLHRRGLWAHHHPILAGKQEPPSVAAK